MARAQMCPEVERLQVLVKQLRDNDLAVCSMQGVDSFDLDMEKEEEIVNALEWLKDFLLNRRNYQRKQQIKKKVMQRLINEHDLAGMLDENIKATYGNDLERFDDNVADD